MKTIEQIAEEKGLNAEKAKALELKWKSAKSKTAKENARTKLLDYLQVKPCNINYLPRNDYGFYDGD
jgi:hypothetical protein